MNVGVSTFHRSTNFGTMLQAQATVLALEKLGYTAELIDYRPEYIERTFRNETRITNLRKALSYVANKTIYGNSNAIRLEHFQNYYKKLKVSKESANSMEQMERIAGHYSVILSGSDQLWNKNITGNDYAYFFPFNHPYKISFSSSFGTKTISQERESEIRPYLRDFKAISVREETAAGILTGVFVNEKKHPEIKKTLDPTMLVSNEEWDEFKADDFRVPNGPFILTYYMIETPLLRKITTILQRQTRLPVVNIKPSKRQMLFHEGINLPDIGPGEFLACYSGASFVVTNSFHGTAFAINYGKPVYVSPLPVSMAGEVNSRFIDLLNTFDIIERWIDTEESLTTIDSNKQMNVKSLTNEKRDESITILKEMLDRQGHLMT